MSQAFELKYEGPSRALGAGTRADRVKTLAERVASTRYEFGLSQKELGSLCGVSQQSIHALEIGAVTHPRYLRELAAALRVRESWLLGIDGEDWTGPEDGCRTAKPSELDVLPIAGELRAGHWRDINLPAEPQQALSMMTRDPRFPDVRQYVYKMCGSSMSQVYADGTHILFAAIRELERELKPGDFVHVERLRDGRFIEHSCKEYVVDDADMVCLRAHTDIAALKEPALLRGDPNGVISITGLAIASYRPEPV